jgi:hypothetical protein
MLQCGCFVNIVQAEEEQNDYAEWRFGAMADFCILVYL